MSFNEQGPQHWDAPAFDGVVPGVIIGGQALSGAEAVGFDFDESGHVVPTIGGTMSWQGGFEDQKAPTSLTPLEIEIEAPLNDLESAARLQRTVALARDLGAQVYVDMWVEEEFVGDGTTTSWVLARQLPYGSTGVTFAQRPAKAFVDTYPNRTSEVEWTVVHVTPTGNQVQVDDTTDATLIETGNAVASLSSLRLRYYPLRYCTVNGLSIDFVNRNEGSMEATLNEFFPVRAFS